jgi:hypothetical protein
MEVVAAAVMEAGSTVLLEAEEEAMTEIVAVLVALMGAEVVPEEEIPWEHSGRTSEILLGTYPSCLYSKKISTWNTQT